MNIFADQYILSIKQIQITEKDWVLIHKDTHDLTVSAYVLWPLFIGRTAPKLPFDQYIERDMKKHMPWWRRLLYWSSHGCVWYDCSRPWLVGCAVWNDVGHSHQGCTWLLRSVGVLFGAVYFVLLTHFSGDLCLGVSQYTTSLNLLAFSSEHNTANNSLCYIRYNNALSIPVNDQSAFLRVNRCVISFPGTRKKLWRKVEVKHRLFSWNNVNFTCWTNQGHGTCSSKCNGGQGDLVERDAGIIIVGPVPHALDV